jgi:hypothetical protein
MAFTVERFQQTRPLLFHLTDRKNIARIRRTRCLESAATLYTVSGDGAMIDQKRTGLHEIRVGGEMVIIRDQTPLHKGNVRFEGAWTFQDLVRRLNELVFFWPGTNAGPIAYGVRHFERYEDDGPVLLRVRFDSLLAANSGRTPLFCKFNSGSPRCSGGLGSVRGPNTFIKSTDCDFTPSNVVEVTFSGRIELPVDVQVGNSPAGPWRRLLSKTQSP